MSNKWRCKLFGHNLESLKKKDILIKEYCCKCCGNKFTTDGYGRLVPLSKYWKENNSLFEKHFQSRVSA